MTKFFKAWLNIWLYVITLISGVIIVFTVIKWHDWSLQTKIFAFATALLPLHVLEEWHFPGGFHYMYNIMAGSKTPDRYPMNQLSDMFTNLIGIIFGIVVLFVGVNSVFLVMQLFLCIAEIFGHTKGGIFSYKKFKEKGKKTIYNPGFVTTLFGYLPIAIAIIVCFAMYSFPIWWQWIIGIGCGIVLGALSLNVPEKITQNENTPYGYDWGNGYFEKYIK